MRNILVVGHGQFSSGLYSAAKFFMSNHEKLRFIDAFTSEESLDDQIAQYFSKMSATDTVVILTDIISGSTTQKCFVYAQRPNCFLITGINLPLLIELLRSEENIPSAAQLNELIDLSRNAMTLIDPEQVIYEDGDE